MVALGVNMKNLLFGAATVALIQLITSISIHSFGLFVVCLLWAYELL